MTNTNHEYSSDQNTNTSNSPINPKRIVLERLKVCSFVFLLSLVLSLLHIGCLIKTFTGISCPGCGMTRAVESALLFHFEKAFYYHPLFPLTPILLLLFIFDDFVKKNLKTILWTIIIVLFFGIYIYRLLFTANDVVSIDIYSGKVLELLNKISAWEVLHD